MGGRQRSPHSVNLCSAQHLGQRRGRSRRASNAPANAMFSSPMGSRAVRLIMRGSFTNISLKTNHELRRATPSYSCRKPGLEKSAKGSGGYGEVK